jgi:hypothetical protein
MKGLDLLNEILLVAEDDIYCVLWPYLKEIYRELF